jgi:EF-P beta-lysylation protein EpmB
LAAAISSPRELLGLLGLEALWTPTMESAAQTFGLKVPRAFVARMTHGDPNDPLLRQVLPIGIELQSPVGFGSDPLAEREFTTAPGLLQKYIGRALLITTGACAVHCRYCFRREFPYAEHSANNPRLKLALEQIAADVTIEEALLSGGDPLSLTDARLGEITAALDSIAHVKRIRVHTRQPIVLPARVDAGLLQWIDTVRKPLVIVLHVNHANEIDDAVRSAVAKLRARGVALLNQSVLLSGVNDSVPALGALSEALFAVGVLPYYLHLLDPVRGAAHFEVSEERAQELHASLANRLAGYLVPRLVREIPGAPGKVLLASAK